MFLSSLNPEVQPNGTIFTIVFHNLTDLEQKNLELDLFLGHFLTRFLLLLQGFAKLLFGQAKIQIIALIFWQK